MSNSWEGLVYWNVYDYSEAARRQREIRAGMPVAPAYNQQHFRARTNVPDPSGVDAAFDAGDAGLSNNWTQNSDTLFRVRWLIQQTEATATNHDALTTEFLLQYQNTTQATGWLTVGDEGDGTDDVEFISCTGFAEGANTTTQLLGAGTQVTGDGLENANISDSITFTAEALTETEIEVSLQIIGSLVDNGDEIQLRWLYSNTDESPPATTFNAATNTPTITVALIGQVYQNSATADGEATTAVDVAVTRGLGVSQADGASTTAVDLAVVGPSGTVYENSATADGAGVTTLSIESTTFHVLSATADGQSAAGSIDDRLYARREVVTEGPLVGQSTTAVDLTVVEGAGTVYENSATADGLATTTVSVTAVRAVAATADGQAGTALTIVAVAGVIELAASADGLSSTSSDPVALRIRDASADGLSSTSVAGSVVRGIAATADGLASASADLERALDASAAGQAVTALDLAVVRASDASADGLSSATSSVLLRAYRDVATDGLSTTAVNLQVGAAKQLAVTADGISSTTVSLVVVEGAEIHSLSAGVAGEATTSITTVRRRTITASADGQSATVVALATVRAVEARADGSAVVTVVVQTGALRTLSATASGQATVAVSVTPVRTLATAAAGIAGVAITIDIVEAVIVSYATGAGVSSSAADLAVLRSVQAVAVGAAAIALDLTHVVGTTAVTGKYANEHARAYADVSAIERNASFVGF